MKSYEAQLNYSVHDSLPEAEKRKDASFNDSQSDFVKLGLTKSTDEWNAVHFVLIEIFPKLLPKSCHRFVQLCKGILKFKGKIVETFEIEESAVGREEEIRYPKSREYEQT